MLGLASSESGDMEVQQIGSLSAEFRPRYKRLFHVISGETVLRQIEIRPDGKTYI